MDTLLVRNIAAVTARRLATVAADVPLRQAARMLAATPVSLVVVCNTGGTIAGVLSKTDIVRALGRNPQGAGNLPAGEAMTCDAVFCRPEDRLGQVLHTMGERGLVHMPVVGSDAKPVGVIEARDALRALFAHASDEAGHLRDYIMGAGYR
jgi:CBS domain-containing protein